MDSEPILDSPWPADLDPATVPFKTRTQTVLRRAGLHDDPIRLDTLTEDEVMGWWNAGPATVADLRFTGNRAIRRHIDATDQRSEMNLALAGVAAEPWAPHVWHRDPRFSRYLPKGDASVQQVAVSGCPDQRRGLWGHLDGLRAAVAAQGSLSLPEAVAEYVSVISGQRGRRLNVLLARAGLNGRDPIPGPRAARMLGVSPARIYQIQDALERHRIRARPPAGVWMPQVTNAEIRGWPGGYTDRGIAATRPQQHHARSPRAQRATSAAPTAAELRAAPHPKLPRTPESIPPISRADARSTGSIHPPAADPTPRPAPTQ